MAHVDATALAAAVGWIRSTPRARGRVELIVRRPAVDEREVLEEAVLDPEVGLVGDTWLQRGSTTTPDGAANPAAQVTLMNARVAALVAGPVERWSLAGDQLYVDFDLGVGHLPPGTWLSLGDAVVEVSAKPHTGCAKFADRFGTDALRFVSSPVGRELRCRGINTKVVRGGTVRRGDAIRKIERAEVPTG